jgi:hypothetical protein
MTHSSPPDPADLRALLEDAPYIDDGGFSDRVARARWSGRQATRFSYVVVPAFALLACVLAFALCGRESASQLAHPGLSLVALSPVIALSLALLLVASASLITADE